MGCIISAEETKAFEATIASIKHDIIGVQGQAVKAGFYTQPGDKTGLGKELLALETGIIEVLGKNAEQALALEREALNLDCRTRYYQTQLAMLSDPKADMTAEKTKERLALLKFLCQEVHLNDQAAAQKTILASLGEGLKIISENLANFKTVEKDLDRLPEAQNIVGLPIMRERLAKSLAAQDEVKKNRANHKPYCMKVASDKVKLNEELKKVGAEHEAVDREYKTNQKNKKKLEDINAHRKETLQHLTLTAEDYKCSLDEFMVGYGNMTTQYHGGPSTPQRQLTNPHNIIV